MYRVIDKFTGRQYGVDCVSAEEARCLQNEHNSAIIVDMNITKEQRKERCKYLWVELKILEEKAACVRNEWRAADTEYLALYNEEY